MPEPQGGVIRWMMVRILPLLVLSTLVACDGGSSRDDQVASLNSGIASRVEGANNVAAERVAPAAPVAKSVPPADGMPSGMQGRWTGLEDRCGDPAAPMELRIENDRLLFHESEGRVTAITPRADGSVLVEAAFTGEGQSWTRRLTLIPQDGGRRLRIDGDGDGVTRKRCPA